MTFDDLMVVERHVADLMSGTGGQLPVMLSKEYDHVDIDATALAGMDLFTFVVRLTQSFGREGCLWNVWVSADLGSPSQTVHISEREKEED